MSDMNMYNILGKLNSIDPKTPAPSADVKKQPVYESVEPRGSITEAVKSLEAKFETFKESAKPDFLDVDKDGNKKEPFKKAVKDKKAVDESFEDRLEQARAKAAAKGLTKEKETAKPAARTVKGSQYGGSKQKDEKEKDDLDEASYSAKQAHAGKDIGKPGKNFSKIAKGAAKRYGSKAAGERVAGAVLNKLRTNENRSDAWSNDQADSDYQSRVNDEWAELRKQQAAKKKEKEEKEKTVDEVAPPGAKAERMVKHIKKGYAKDGKLTKREKGIAYATAWKAHNKGHVEEGTEFKDTIKNSAAKMTKAKPAKLKESADLRKHPIYTTQEAWDHYAKELAEQEGSMGAPVPADPLNNELDEIAALAGLARTAAPAAISAASNMISDSEDVQLPPPPPHEDPIVIEGDGVTINGKPVNVNSIEVDGVYDWDRPDYADAYVTYAEFEDGTPLSDVELDQLTDQHGDLVNQAANGMASDRGAAQADYAKDLDEEMASEGNEFSGALAKAKAEGKKDFEVDGKRYTVKEDIALSATGDDVVNLIRKLAGMDTVEPEMPAVLDATPIGVEEVPMDAEMGPEEPEFEVAEERDIEYTNSPREETAGLAAAIPSGNDMHRAKKSYSDKPYHGDNPMAVEENLWKSYESMIKDVIKK